MQMQRIRLSEVFDSLPFIGRELEGISSDALLDPLVEFFFLLFMIKIYVSKLSNRVNFFSASPSLMDTIQSKLHAIWFPNTLFPMSVSSLLLSKAQIDLDKDKCQTGMKHVATAYTLHIAHI